MHTRASRISAYARTIMEKADEVDAPDGNIYVRTAWEMGGEWNRWGQQGNDNRDGFNDPSHDVLWQTYWDSNSAYPGLMSDGSDSASGAAYRDAFG